MQAKTVEHSINDPLGPGPPKYAHIPAIPVMIVAPSIIRLAEGKKPGFEQD